jgi:hypothetical protein
MEKAMELRNLELRAYFKVKKNIFILMELGKGSVKAVEGVSCMGRELGQIDKVEDGAHSPDNT